MYCQAIKRTSTPTASRSLFRALHEVPHPFGLCKGTWGESTATPAAPGRGCPQDGMPTRVSLLSVRWIPPWPLAPGLTQPHPFTPGPSGWGCGMCGSAWIMGLEGSDGLCRGCSRHPGALGELYDAWCSGSTALTPPPPCASTALWKHRVGVERLFLGLLGTTVFVVPDVTWGLKPLHRTLPPDDFCVDELLSHS